MKDPPSLPVAVDRTWQLWLDARIVDFPTLARAGLGQRLIASTLDLLDLLVRATYAPRDSAPHLANLIEARHRLTLLGLLLRGARERRYLSLPQYDHAAEHLAAITRMVHGWIRHSAQPSPR